MLLRTKSNKLCFIIRPMNLVYLSWFYRQYYYYHCSFAFGCRFKAEDINKVLKDQLNSLSISPEHSELTQSMRKARHKSKRIRRNI
jgi:hypothetical protein